VSVEGHAVSGAPLCRLRDTPFPSGTACPSTDTAALGK